MSQSYKIYYMYIYIEVIRLGTCTCMNRNLSIYLLLLPLSPHVMNLCVTYIYFHFFSTTNGISLHYIHRCFWIRSFYTNLGFAFC